MTPKIWCGYLPQGDSILYLKVSYPLAARVPTFFFFACLSPFFTMDLLLWLYYCQYSIRDVGAVNNRKVNSDWLKKLLNRFVFNTHNFLAHKSEVWVLSGFWCCLIRWPADVFKEPHTSLPFLCSVSHSLGLILRLVPLWL